MPTGRFRKEMIPLPPSLIDPRLLHPPARNSCYIDNTVPYPTHLYDILYSLAVLQHSEFVSKLLSGNLTLQSSSYETRWRSVKAIRGKYTPFTAN